MEGKELNLVELLKNCGKEKFYSLIVGDVIFEGIDSHWEQEVYKPIICTGGNYNSDGTYTDPSDNGVCCLYPSRALYEKYPLDAYSAWMEWRLERTPKRWRAEEGEQYYYIGSNLIIGTHIEHRYQEDYNLHVCGNYFKKFEEAQQAAEAVGECLTKFQEQNKK